MGAVAVMAKEQKFANWEDVPLILSSQQVANLLGIHRNTVKLLYDEGNLKGFEVGRLLKFHRAEVMRYVGLVNGEDK